METSKGQQRKFLKPKRNNNKNYLTRHEIYSSNQYSFIDNPPSYKNLSKECATQTSTTFLYNNQHNINNNNNNNTDDEDVTSSDSLRSNSQQNYTDFHEIAERKLNSTHLINFNVEHKSNKAKTVNESDTKCNDDTLLKIYLTKFNKNVNDNNVTTLNVEKENYKLDRCDFLLQTSPFNRVLDEQTNMKSKSHVANNQNDDLDDNSTDNDNYYMIYDNTSNCQMNNVNAEEQVENEVVRNKTHDIYNENEKLNNYCDSNTQYYLSTNKNVNATSKQIPKYVKNYFAKKKLSYRKFKSKSFMSGTISSEQKNILNKVKSVDCLVSPIRRGRIVTSPTKYRVPYIDENKSDKSNSYKKLLTRIPSTSNLHSNDDNFFTFNNDLAIDTVSIQPPSNETAILAIMNRIKNPDWNISLKALADLVVKCANNLDEFYNHLPIAYQRILQLIKSSRRYASKCACQICANLFQIARDTRRPEFDELVDVLLTKTADCNKSIREEANLALDCMVTNLPFSHALRALTAKGPNHKNPLVRFATIRLIICAIVLLNPTILFNPCTGDNLRKKVMEVMIKFVLDKNQDVRKYGERLYKLLSKEAGFTIYLWKYFEKKQVSEFLKSLKSVSQANIQ